MLDLTGGCHTHRLAETAQLNRSELWGDFEAVVTVILVCSVLHHSYRTCFPQYLSGAICVPVLDKDQTFGP